MLRELLALIASGGRHSPESAALALGLGRAEVEDMLTRLCALGYLEELSAAMAASCADSERKSCAGCAACPLGAGCFKASQNRVWSLTPKGLESLKRSG
jgi:hypothetical protein